MYDPIIGNSFIKSPTMTGAAKAGIEISVASRIAGRMKRISLADITDTPFKRRIVCDYDTIPYIILYQLQALCKTIKA